MADLINAIQNDDQKAVEINGHLMQAKNLNNVTSESSDRKRCRDLSPPGTCSYWKKRGYCKKPFGKKRCKKTCGNCPEKGTLVHNLVTLYLINDNSDSDMNILSLCDANF